MVPVQDARPHVGGTAGAELRPSAEDGVDVRERRIEDWIVGTLQDDPTERAHDPWAELIGPIALRRTPKRPTDSGSRGSGAQPPDWKRFSLARRQGITVLSLSDQSLTRPNELNELVGDLLALIGAGHTRIVLRFDAVERLSSAIVHPLAEAERRCSEARGGALRICGLRPELAPLFSLTGLDQRVSIQPDEAAAFDASWPACAELRPLPVAVLSALTARDPGVSGFAHVSPVQPAPLMLPLESQPAPAPETEPTPTPAREPGPGRLTEMSSVRLIIESGRARGRTIAVRGSRFLIGRDRGCQLRPAAATISRFHAALECRDGNLFLRGLHSANGTSLNGRVLRGEVAELRAGDRVEVGPVIFTVAIGRGGARPRVETVEELIAGWLRDETPPDADPVTMNELPVRLDAEQVQADSLKHELIEGVLVVTPLAPELDGESILGTLRARLAALLENELPRRVVINLSHVAEISGRAIGVLVAHHLRLERVGGSVRVCEANPRVSAVLEQIRLSMLLECHPRLDDAVLSSWTSAGDSGAVSV
jgi:anti-anti-sigma factor